MPIRFKWDPDKAARNLSKHGVSFTEATTVFGDPLSLTIDDPDHSEEEVRFITLGHFARGSLLVIVHIEQGQATRVISAREAMRRERQDYEEGRGF